MRRIQSVFTAMLLLGAPEVFAQTDTGQVQTYTFNLSDCIGYALEHQRDVVNAGLDVRNSEEKIRESTGKLLPHADVNASFTDNMKLATSLIPDIFNGRPDVKIPVQFGTRFASAVTGQINQTLFNSDYFIGLKAARVYRGLSEKSYTRTAIDTRVAVTKAYYAVLVNEENIRLVAANEAQLKKTLKDTRARYDAGVAERVDVDRITVTYNNVITNLENQRRLLAYTMELLKFQMGFPQDYPLRLKETVKDISPARDLADTLSFRPEDRVEYSLQQTQIELNKLNMKSKKMGYLPSLSAYVNYGFNYFSSEFGELYKNGFGASAFGLTLAWPIFTGTERLHQIKQEQITVQKSVNDLDYIRQQINIQVKDSYTSFLNNMALLRTQQSNMELTQGIYDRIVLKFEQGVATSLDVISAESELKQAQSDYVNALLNALVSKTDLDKAMGKIR